MGSANGSRCHCLAVPPYKSKRQMDQEPTPTADPLVTGAPPAETPQQVSPEALSLAELAFKAHDYYFREREALILGEGEAVKSFDTHLITLSTAALGLSVLFIEKLASHPEPSTLTWLVIAWFLFGITLCLMLISFLMSQSSWSRQREILDHNHKIRQEHLPEGTPLPKSSFGFLPEDSPWTISFRKLEAKHENAWGELTRQINRWALGFFMTGVFSLLLFCALNIGDRMTNRETRATTPGEQRGASATPSAVPPPLPTSGPGQASQSSSTPNSATTGGSGNSSK